MTLKTDEALSLHQKSSFRFLGSMKVGLRELGSAATHWLHPGRILMPGSLAIPLAIPNLWAAVFSGLLTPSRKSLNKIRSSMDFKCFRADSENAPSPASRRATKQGALMGGKGRHLCG